MKASDPAVKHGAPIDGEQANRRQVARGRLALCLLCALVLLGALGLALVAPPRHTVQAAPAPAPFDGYDNVASGGDDEHHGGPGEADDGDINGYILSRPAGAVGMWQIQCSPTQVCAVASTQATVFGRGALTATTGWVEARGVFSGSLLLAELIRMDDIESSEVVVRLEAGVPYTTFAEDKHLTPIATLLGSANIHLFALDDDDVEEEVEDLSQEDEVVWAEANIVNHIPSDDGFKTWKWGGESTDGYINQEAFAQVVLSPALTVEQGDGAVVAVLDTGVDLNHPAFGGRVLPGRDVVADDAEAMDEGPGFGWGHGTHVAGIVARVAPQAKIMPVRVLNQDGRGNVFTLAYAIEWAVLNGANVINLSLGAEANSQTLSETILWAQAQGVVVVAAAGNDNSPERQYPAGLPSVVSVAAIDLWDRKAAFSNYGDWVDIAAPGVGITSSVPFSGGVGYAGWSGTSMSTAFVSGAAALLRAHGVPASGVEEALTSSAGSLATTDATYGNELGGLLNVGRALGLDVANPAPPPLPSPTPPPDTTPTPQPGETHIVGYLPFVRR